ncbi:MAG: pentapeptide repeat-containing protein [Candidatus Krumholzibacteriia bacterium]
MASQRPRFLKEEMYQLLRVDNVKAFNIRKQNGQTCELCGTDLRGLDLRGLDADGLDFSGCYFRDTDLRGVDLSRARLEGASFFGCKISGAYFPPELSSDEIRLSLEHGTRVRYRT